MKLILESISENEAFARTVVAAYITRLDPTLEELADVLEVLKSIAELDNKNLDDITILFNGNSQKANARNTTVTLTTSSGNQVIYQANDKYGVTTSPAGLHFSAYQPDSVTGSVLSTSNNFFKLILSFPSFHNANNKSLIFIFTSFSLSFNSSSISFILLFL